MARAAGDEGAPASPLASAGNPHRALLEDAAWAVRLASRLCVDVQRGLTQSERQDKSDDSPVTVADYGAQAVVAWALRARAGGAALSMVAEEDSSGLQGDAGAALRARVTALVNDVLAQHAGDRAPRAPLTEAEVLALVDLGGSPGGAEGAHWVLDPIDGTRGFVGMRQYAVCLGRIESGRVTLGGCPAPPPAPPPAGPGTSRRPPASPPQPHARTRPQACSGAPTSRTTPCAGTTGARARRTGPGRRGSGASSRPPRARGRTGRRSPARGSRTAGAGSTA